MRLAIAIALHVLLTVGGLASLAMAGVPPIYIAVIFFFTLSPVNRITKWVTKIDVYEILFN